MFRSVIDVVRPHIVIQRLHHETGEFSCLFRSGIFPHFGEDLQRLRQERIKPSAGDECRCGDIGNGTHGIGTSAPEFVSGDMLHPILPDLPFFQSDCGIQIGERQMPSHGIPVDLQIGMKAAEPCPECPDRCQTEAPRAAGTHGDGIKFQRCVMRGQPFHDAVSVTRQLPLGVTGIGFPVGHDIAVAEILFGDPVEKILPVLALLTGNIEIAIGRSGTSG